MAACLTAFADTDLVFFDPDNGLEVPSLRVGRKNSSKYVYLDEVRAFYDAGKSVLIYQHFPRMERETFVAACAERLRTVAPDAALWTFRTKHVVFLLLIHRKAIATLHEAASAAASRWDPTFIAVAEVTTPGDAMDVTFGSADEPASTDAALPAPLVLATVAEVSAVEAPTDASDGADTEPQPVEPGRPSLVRRLLRRLQ